MSSAEIESPTASRLILRNLLSFPSSERTRLLDLPPPAGNVAVRNFLHGSVEAVFVGPVRPSAPLRSRVPSWRLSVFWLADYHDGHELIRLVTILIPLAAAAVQKLDRRGAVLPPVVLPALTHLQGKEASNSRTLTLSPSLAAHCVFTRPFA